MLGGESLERERDDVGDIRCELEMLLLDQSRKLKGKPEVGFKCKPEVGY
jgi:hypothetical protein